MKVKYLQCMRVCVCGNICRVIKTFILINLKVNKKNILHLFTQVSDLQLRLMKFYAINVNNILYHLATN